MLNREDKIIDEHITKLPEDKIFCHCDSCHGEIYYGNEYKDLAINGDLLKIHEHCLDEFLEIELVIETKVAGD